MVLLKTAIAGFGILTIGVLMLTMVGQYVTMDVQQVQMHEIEPHAEFLVGDFVDRTYTLPGSVHVLGTVGVSQAPSNQTSDVRFLVFDADNYQKWSSGDQASFVYSTDKQGQFNYTFTPGTTGTYHFVFDNRASVYKKYVTLTIAYEEVITSRIPDPRVGYLSFGLILVGSLVFLYGMIRKPPLTWN